jgi:zinc/manganese transport system substrate-binding protein
MKQAIHRSLVALALALGAQTQAHAALRVFACEPEWASLAHELGGDLVQVTSATTPQQDVHYIQARPSLISQIRRADLVVCTGAELEVGWLPVLLRQGGNAKVQVGAPGYFEAASAVQLLEVPASVDRAQGDIHPFGNPHIQLDPHNIAAVAAALAQKLASVDPANAAAYEARARDFDSRWAAAMARWDGEGKPLAGLEFVCHHRSYVYLAHWLGLVEVASLEPKPGIEPSTGHLAEVLDQIGSHHVKVIVRSAYQSSRASDWLSGRTGIAAIVLPHTVGSVPGTDDLFALFDDILKQLNEVAR